MLFRSPAGMGDGEVCGCGVEVAGEVEVTVDVLKGFDLGHPAVETEEELMVAGEGGDLTAAVRTACGRMHPLLTRLGGMTPTDAYFFMSTFGQIEVCQCAFCYGSLLGPEEARASVRMTIPRIFTLPTPTAASAGNGG